MIESTDDNLKGSFNNLKGFHDYKKIRIAIPYNRWGSFNLFHFSKLEGPSKAKERKLSKM